MTHSHQSWYDWAVAGRFGLFLFDDADRVDLSFLARSDYKYSLCTSLWYFAKCCCEYFGVQFDVYCKFYHQLLLLDPGGWALVFRIHLVGSKMRRRNPQLDPKRDLSWGMVVEEKISCLDWRRADWYSRFRASKRFHGLHAATEPINEGQFDWWGSSSLLARHLQRTFECLFETGIKWHCLTGVMSFYSWVY